MAATVASQTRSVPLIGTQTHSASGKSQAATVTDSIAATEAVRNSANTRQLPIAALLAEPALTNFGLVPPDPIFWDEAQELCRQYGTLLILDETHTLSTGPGGYAIGSNLEPDFLVVGKAVAGGLPCAVYGFTDEVAQRMQDAKTSAPPGHSGIGTTLTANPLTLAALQAALEHLHTPYTYAHMLNMAHDLQEGLQYSSQGCQRLFSHRQGCEVLPPLSPRAIRPRRGVLWFLHLQR